MQTIYTSGEYVARHPGYHVEDSRWKSEHILRMLESHQLRPRTVCEVGCGAGEILAQLQKRLQPTTRFFGYDVSPQAISLCQQRANEQMQFFCSDFTSDATERFEMLLCMDVIEHVDDYIGFLRKLRDRADLHLFHIPLDLSAQVVFRGKPLAKKRTALGHLHYFTKDTALATLQYAGYSVLDWNYTGSGVDKTRTWLAKLAKFPRIVMSQLARDFTVRAFGGFSLLVLTRHK